MGLPFSFSDGIEDGLAKLSIWRLGQNWSKRSRRSAVFVRSTLSVGLDAFDATQNNGDIADGQFVKWALQAQRAQRLALWHSQLILRGELQLSHEALLGLEKFSIGGHSSVRGYRENTFSGDRGAFVSSAWRIPLWSKRESRFDLSTFIDSAYIKDTGDNQTSESLSSVGFGLRWSIGGYVEIDLQWAEALDDIKRQRGDNEQDKGLHVRAALHL